LQLPLAPNLPICYHLLLIVLLGKETPAAYSLKHYIMKPFKRVLGYVKQEYRAVILSILCAVFVAILFALSLGAMLPLMKVMIGEEGLHGWINRAIVKNRSGISFIDVPLGENIVIKDADKSRQPKLRISSVKQGSPADGIGLRKQDVVLAVFLENDQNIQNPIISDPPVEDQIQVPVIPNRDDLLEKLAHAPSDSSIQLKIEHDDGSSDTVKFTVEPEPFYTHTANWLLSFVPRIQEFESKEELRTFKRDCIVKLIILMLIATIARCLFRFLQEYLVKKLSYRSIMRFRRDAYTNAIRMPLLHFSTRGVADTMSRFIQDSNRIHTGITTLLGKIVREPFTIIFLAIGAFAINAKITLFAMMGVPIAGFVISQLGRKMKKASKKTLENWSRMLGRLQESLQGIRIVKGYHQETQEEQVFEKINKRLIKQQFRMAKINAASGPLLESLGMTAACAAMIAASYYLTGEGMSTSDFFALVFLLGAIAESGRKLGNVFPRIQAANAAAERMCYLLDVPAEEEAAGARELGRLTQGLSMRSLSFTYPEQVEPALSGIDLEVRAGQTVAIVGPNGSGKTTLVSLIPRFYQPDEGVVLIDGQDIAEVTLASLREQIGIVTQQTIVFNDTVGGNIAYAKPSASREEIVEAAKRAYAHEFIEQLPNGYDSIVGEQGAKLSGGQLQRLTIARAILRDPAILIFDEATSQIDSDSEAKIQKAILEFTQGRTSFIIAHRLSTIIHADRIVVLEAGRIVAQGTHEELFESCKLYRQLYEMQFATHS
jgi:ATP-binding cassette, subfamily B, bacterial MsbA